MIAESASKAAIGKTSKGIALPLTALGGQVVFIENKRFIKSE